MGLKKFVEEKETTVSKKEPQVSTKETQEVVEKTNSKETTLINKIEAARNEFKAEQKKQKKLNYLVTAIMITILIGAFVLVMTRPVDGEGSSPFVWVGIALMGGCLIGSYFVTSAMKKSLTSKANTYIEKLFEESSTYVYSDGVNKNITVQPLGKMEDNDFYEGHFYSNLKGTKSRNLVNFTRNNLSYSSCDLAANCLVKNRLSPKFLGKFYKIEFKGNYKHTTILQMKGNNLSIPIDNVDGLNLIEDNEKYIIYSDDADAKKIVDGKLLNTIKLIKINDPVVDIIFSIKNNTIRIGIDYVDSFLTIPVEENFDLKFTKKSMEDFADIAKIVDQTVANINKSKKTSK